jgi:hypothetical protein
MKVVMLVLGLLGINAVVVHVNQDLHLQLDTGVKGIVYQQQQQQQEY